MKNKIVSSSEVSFVPENTETHFRRGADLKEGIAGRCPIFTNENAKDASCSTPETHYTY